MKFNFSNNKVFFSGSAGFIGSNLCESLIEKRNKIVCLDSFATRKRRNL